MRRRGGVSDVHVLIMQWRSIKSRDVVIDNQ